MCCFVPRLEGVTLGIAGTLEERWDRWDRWDRNGKTGQPPPKKEVQMEWVFYGFLVFFSGCSVVPLNQSENSGFDDSWKIGGMFWKDGELEWEEKIPSIGQNQPKSIKIFQCPITSLQTYFFRL